MAKWRRGRRCAGPGWHGWAALPHEEMEDQTMSVSGGACSAYRCRVQEYKLVVIPTTTLRSECARIDDAQERLERGEEVTVAGYDIERLRQRLAAFGVA